MNFNVRQLFDVFSNRPQASAMADQSLTVEFRNRIMFACRDTFRDTFYGSQFWKDMHQRLQYVHGRQFLASRHLSDPLEDLANFLGECSDKHFLDFVELIFQPHEQSLSASKLVSVVNKFLQIDDLPYSLTDFVWVPVENEPYAKRLAAYPQIIRRENEVLHNIAIEPTLTFLRNPAFASANKEFLGALSDYRKGEFQDCVLKCNSSLESVMKVICDRKGWPYPGNADATTLLTLILPKTNLPSFYKNRLQVVPITRNEKSSAHGAGSQPRVVDKHVAGFIVNSTAAAILLLVEETSP